MGEARPLLTALRLCSGVALAVALFCRWLLWVSSARSQIEAASLEGCDRLCFTFFFLCSTGVAVIYGFIVLAPLFHFVFATLSHVLQRYCFGGWLGSHGFLRPEPSLIASLASPSRSLFRELA